MEGADELRLEEVLLPEDRRKVASLLDRLGLHLAEGLELTLALYRGERLVGTGSLSGSVIQCVGILAEERGQNLTARIVTDLLDRLHRSGRHHSFVFTTPASSFLFQGLGFREVGRAPDRAVLLEHGDPTLRDHLAELSRHRGPPTEGPVGAVVVNCNPFTLGHRALIESARTDCDRVFVLVVQEDRSSFPFPVRLELVRQGTADLPDVVVLPGGPYIISGATFPNYFLKASDQELLATQTRLDLDIFARHIAPALGISRRYVGDEPLCPVTRAYNQAMGSVLPEHELELRIMDRRRSEGQIISASLVRRALGEEDWPTIRRMVPASTLSFLRSPTAGPILEDLRRRGDARH